MASDRKAKPDTSVAGVEVQPATLHEILVAWQSGRLTARRAMALGGLDGFPGLYDAARSSGVPIRKTLLPAERKAAERATAAIRKRLASEIKERS